MRRAVVIAKIVLWACAGLMAILVILSWVAPGVRDERSFLLLGGAAVGPAMVCSAFLLWRELRDNRRGCAPRGGRAATSPSRRAPSGRPRCGSTCSPSSAPSPGTSCPPCSFPSSEPEPRPPGGGIDRFRAMARSGKKRACYRERVGGDAQTTRLRVRSGDFGRPSGGAGSRIGRGNRVPSRPAVSTTDRRSVPRCLREAPLIPAPAGLL